MTYHLDPGAPLADEIRGVALDQIDRAARSLDTGPYLLVEKPKALARRLTGIWSLSVARAG